MQIFLKRILGSGNLYPRQYLPSGVQNALVECKIFTFGI